MFLGLCFLLPLHLICKTHCTALGQLRLLNLYFLLFPSLGAFQTDARGLSFLFKKDPKIEHIYVTLAKKQSSFPFFRHFLASDFQRQSFADHK